ncbi:hypothetical protein [Zhongshania sp.]
MTKKKHNEAKQLRMEKATVLDSLGIATRYAQGLRGINTFEID